MSDSVRCKKKALARESASASSQQKTIAKVDSDLCKSTNTSMVETQKTGAKDNTSRPSQPAATLAGLIEDEVVDADTVVEAEDTAALAEDSGAISADDFLGETQTAAI